MKLLVAVTFALSIFSAPAAVVAESQPDIIVVMVDDLGAIDERILTRLPNIKSLFLDGGLRFDAAYSETPLCCPGRASFLTGQHTRRHGVTRNIASLLKPSATIATVLRNAGYWTVMTGKYLNGARRLADKTPPGWDHVAMLDWKPNSTNPSRWWVDDVEQFGVGYDDRFVLTQSVAWLGDAPADQPVFLYANTTAPHWVDSNATPWKPVIEPAYATDERCAGIEPWKPPTYAYPKQPGGFPLDDICRSLLTVDDMVGALRTAAADADRNPVWVFMSDNGMAWGRDGFPIKNVPQAGRLPFYMAGPGIVAGSTSALISNIDIGPTLAALAGTTMPAADGVSFAGVLRGNGGGRDWMLEDHPVGGVTAGPWQGRWWGVRTPRWHLVKIKDWRFRLYDVSVDPWETRNVRRSNKAVVRQLKALAAPLLTPLK